MMQLAQLRALMTLTGAGTHTLCFSLHKLFPASYKTVCCCLWISYVSSKGEKKKAFSPSLCRAVRYVNNLSRMHEKRPVRPDMFLVSVTLHPQTLLSKAVISCPLCCFLSDMRLRRAVDLKGRREEEREGDNNITICLSDRLDYLLQNKAALGPATTDKHLSLCSALA